MYDSYTFVHAYINHWIPQNGQFCKLDWKNSHVEWNILKFKHQSTVGSILKTIVKFSLKKLIIRAILSPHMFLYILKDNFNSLLLKQF